MRGELREGSRCKPACRQAGRVWRIFCHPGTGFYGLYECRGTSLIGASRLSRYRIFVEGTGAVSRYKFDRSQKFITVQDFNCGQMRVPALSPALRGELREGSGCNGHYEFVLGAGALPDCRRQAGKAKSVTTCPARREATYLYCPCIMVSFYSLFRLYTFPSFITNITFCKMVISSSGFPLTAIMSAK